MMVYGVDSMLLVEIDMLSQRGSHFNEEENKSGLEYEADFIDELREVTCVLELGTNNRNTKRYKLKVKPREMQAGDLVLKEVVIPTQQEKIQPNQNEPYHVFQKLTNRVYKLQELE